MVGKAISKQTVDYTPGQTYDIDVSEFQTGIYFVRCTDKENILTKKLTIN